VVVPSSRISGRVAELIREGAARVLHAPDEMLAQVDAASLVEHDPAVAADPVLLDAFRRANRATIAHWAQSTLRDPGGEVSPFVGPESLGLARDLVRRGLDQRAVAPYRAGQNAAWQAWMEIAFPLTQNQEELRELLRVSSRSIFAYVDATSAAIIEQMGLERGELRRGTNAERLETVTLVLEDSPIDLDRAARRLGYSFNRTHIAAIIWAAEPLAVGHDLERAATSLTAAAGAQRALTVVASSAALWVWVAASTELATGPLEQSVADMPEVRVALGTPASGIDGFRRSHFQAFATQRLLARLASAVQLARYGSIRVASLATEDERQARDFVTETLGDLLDASPTLRDTLRTYLQRQSNATRAAAALYTHRNTVVSRLAKAEALLPRPLDQSAFEVAVALEVLHWSGPTDGYQAS
jgi:DNA-binding PucR family transcriptional regulator